MHRRWGVGAHATVVVGVLLPLQTGLWEVDLFGLSVVWLVLAGGVLGLALGVTVRLARMRWGDSDVGGRSGRLMGDGADIAEPFYTESESGGSADTPESPSSGALEDSDESPEPGLSVTVDDRLTAGEYREAVQTAYVETRGLIADEIGVSVNGTHWDFYKECEEAETDAFAESVFELTELYERAVFGQQETSAEEAERAVDRSREILSQLRK